MQVQQEKRVRTAPVRFQAPPVAILKKKTKMFQRKTKFLHARFGDGITLMVDMVPKQAKQGGGGVLGNKALNVPE